MLVKELMRRPVVTCRPSMGLGATARLMRDRNVGCVLVVNDLGRLAGIVTDRDIALRGVGEGRSADAAVELVMTRDVATITVDADGSEAGVVMAENMVRRLPVVDDLGIPRGLVSFDDLVRAVGEETDALVDTVVLQTTRRPFD